MAVDLQPTLHGETVVIRPLAASDWDAFYAIARDPLIWEVHPFSTRWQEPVARAYFFEGLASGGGVAITQRAAGSLIGSSRLSYHADRRAMEVGSTFVARDYWGGAVNHEVKRLMLAHALRFAERVEFRVGATNIRSRRAMEKIGGWLTDRLDHTEVEGKPVVHVIYEIDRAMFAAGPLNQLK